MDSETSCTSALDDEGNQRRQQWEWFAERCGRLLIAAVVIAALLGFLGPGALSHATKATSDNSIQIEHDRIQRYQAPAELIIRIVPPIDSTLIRIALSRSLVDHVTIESIIPQPATITSQGDDVVYAFPVTQREREVRVIVRYENNSFGSIHYSVTALDGQSLSLSHFVCP